MDKLDLYYYTTTSTMRFIMQGANIYATNLKYMNDAEEYVNGLTELYKLINRKKPGEISRELLKSRLEEEPDGYSISFSTKRDLLSQWSMYAKESGVSLRMNFEKLHKYKFAVIGQKGEEIITHEAEVPKKVYYYTDTMDVKEYQQISEEIWNQRLYVDDFKLEKKDFNANVEQIWKDNVPYIKRHEFKAEGEYRLVFRQSDFAEPLKIDYRIDKNVLKPYLDVTCMGGWPIREVIVGPGFNQHIVFESISHFLQHAELKLPLLTDEEFQERCEEYLEGYIYQRDEVGNKSVNTEILKLWREKKENLKNGKEDRFLQWLDLRKQIEMHEGDVFNTYIKNREITKDGIILSKSSIPYIF